MEGVVDFVFVTVLTAVCASCVAEYSGSLRLVNVVLRHGERTPVDTYPNDPHVNYNFPPYGWGQLTNDGKLKQYQLGQFLRSRYGDFLGDIYSSDILRVQSTGKDRTMMSAQLAAAGLFPPVGYQKWKPDLNWQPIPVHSQAVEDDSLLLVTTCPRFYEELERVKNIEEVKQYLNTLTDLFTALTKHTGMTIANPDDVQSLYNTLLAEANFNLTLPEWSHEYFPEKMAAVTAYSFVLNAYSDELQKLKGGPLLKKVLKDSEEKSKDSSSKRKMFMYAGHDSTIANLMMALKVWEEQIPVYNILVMIELHQEDNVYGLKVFLRNSTEHEPYLLKIPSCDEFCSLDKIMDLSKKVLPDDIHKECLTLDPNFVTPAPNEV